MPTYGRTMRDVGVQTPGVSEQQECVDVSSDNDVHETSDHSTSVRGSCSRVCEDESTAASLACRLNEATELNSALRRALDLCTDMSASWNKTDHHRHTASETVPSQHPLARQLDDLTHLYHQVGWLTTSTSFGWGKGWNATSAGWQVTLCDPIWHVSSSSGEVCCELLYPVTTTTTTTTTTTWLEFNVPFQHKYGYIRDELSAGTDRRLVAASLASGASGQHQAI